jgi:hypothetical protein
VSKAIESRHLVQLDFLSSGAALKLTQSIGNCFASGHLMAAGASLTWRRRRALFMSRRPF